MGFRTIPHISTKCEKLHVYMYSETDTRTQQIGHYCLHHLNTEICFQANWKLSKHFFLGRQNKIDIKSSSDETIV